MNQKSFSIQAQNQCVMQLHIAPVVAPYVAPVY